MAAHTATMNIEGSMDSATAPLSPSVTILYVKLTINHKTISAARARSNPPCRDFAIARFFCLEKSNQVRLSLNS